jgi:hypothetical protein
VRGSPVRHPILSTQSTACAGQFCTAIWLFVVENPIQLVEVRGFSKKRRKPAVLTIEQFSLAFGLLKEPYHIMSVVEQCCVSASYLRCTSIPRRMVRRS